ncbi:MAG: glucose-1-phosphate adenylyltransferase [Chitinophagaceae bacterium]|nr:glucose-1-phosphate adenylyltransferase [Chitinophagaceae bacterium]
MQQEKVLAVILGGGAGTRLSPLTASRSKPAVPIAGKYRLVDIPVSNCINSGIQRMFVLTQFNSASLNKHIKNTYHFSAFSKAFVDILAAEQTPDNPRWFMGTADAVRQSLHHLNNNDYEYVLILSGDQLYQMNFMDLLDYHEKMGAEISIATIPVNGRDAPEYGIMKTTAEGFIESFIEKPKKELLPAWTSEVSDSMKAQGREYLASMGIYVFNKKTLIDLLEEKIDATDFGKEIIPQSIGNHKILSYQHEGYWTDIGNIRSYFEANLALTDEIPDFNLFDNRNVIYTHARMLPPAKISGTTLNASIVAEGSIVRAAKIDRSIIGIRSRIGEGSVIVSSYIIGNDSFQTLESIKESIRKGIPIIGIGDRCYIQNTIIDKDCYIGNDVHIKGGSHLPDMETNILTVKDGIVVVKKGAIVPDRFGLG